MQTLNSVICKGALMLSAILFIADFAQASDRWYVGPACIDKFCFAVNSIDQLVPENDFIMRYGKGFKIGEKFAVYCYVVEEQQLFVHFRPYHGEAREIMSIFVSDVPNCPSSNPPNIPFDAFITPEGLRIGDSFDKVISLYGNPLKTGKATGFEKIGLNSRAAADSQPFGEKVLVYGSLNKRKLLHTEIYIRDNTVSAILITVFP